MTIGKKPIYLGAYSALAGGDIRDLGIGMTAELADGDTISSVTLTVTDAGNNEEAGAITAQTVDPDVGVTFTLAAPATPGTYGITAVFTLADGQKITKTASITIY